MSPQAPLADSTNADRESSTSSINKHSPPQVLLEAKASLKSTSAARLKKLTGVDGTHISPWDSHDGNRGQLPPWQTGSDCTEAGSKELHVNVDAEPSPLPSDFTFQDGLEGENSLFEESERPLQEQDEDLVEMRKQLSSFEHRDGALDAARHEVVHHEQELFGLPQSLASAQAEVAELHKAKEFAEAETKAVRGALEYKTAAHLSEMLDLQKQLALAEETNAELASALASAQIDLADALAREARQDETSRSLISAQEELEAAYDDAVAQLEAWKSQHGLESETKEDPEHGSVSISGDDRSHADEGAEDGYDVIDLHDEIDSPMQASRSFRAKLQRLVRPMKSNGPSRRAVTLFAVKELEDDLDEQQSLLIRLVDDFASADPTRPRPLQRLQKQIEETMHLIQLTGAKLKAVKSFAG